MVGIPQGVHREAYTGCIYRVYIGKHATRVGVPLRVYGRHTYQGGVPLRANQGYIQGGVPLRVYQGGIPWWFTSGCTREAYQGGIPRVVHRVVYTCHTPGGRAPRGALAKNGGSREPPTRFTVGQFLSLMQEERYILVVYAPPSHLVYASPLPVCR